MEGRKTLHVKVSINEILDELGCLEDSHFKDALAHLADVALQNGDEVGLDLLHDAMGIGGEQNRSLMALLLEAVAVGKEITLRRMCKAFDPHGEWLDVPKDWIGKGEG